MSLAAAAIIFVVLWVLTFIPAWYLAIKIAITIKSKPAKLSKVITLFLAYEVVIILPYLSILWGVSGFSELLSALIFALIILICAVQTIRLLDIDKLKSILWTTYSYCYDSLLHFYPYEELMDLISDRVNKYVKNGSVIADIGSGTGNVSYKILEGVEDVELYVVEPNLQMFKRSRKKLSNFKKDSTVTFVNKDAVSYLESIHDKALDIVVMCNVLYTIDDRETFWRLLSEKLNTSGVAVISNSDRGGSKWLIKYHLIHSNILQLFRPKLISVGIVDGFINQLSDGNFFGFTSKAELESEISNSRLKMFEVVRCYGGIEHGVNLLFTVRKCDL
jgi:ubiquinone/menaquinone biosynthesis C-methylase UbiE